MKNRCLNGYLTVYLSLTLSLILSFVLTLVEGARMSAVRMDIECAADIGMNSVLAEYHRELLEQYDLLFVDTSYGTAKAGIRNTEDHLRRYMQGNFGPSSRDFLKSKDWLSLSVDKAVITQCLFASDGEGDEMKRQVLSYLESSTPLGPGISDRGPEHFAGHMEQQMKQMETFSLDTRDITAERNSIQGQIDSIELPKEEEEDGTLREITLDNPADRVNASRGISVLNLIGKNASEISNAAVSREEYISNRLQQGGMRKNITLLTGSPERELRQGEKVSSGFMEKLLFHEYLFEKCGRYGQTKDNSLLKYQLEYILAGKKSDWDNLESVAKKLLRWREAANVIYIFSDASKCAEAKALALTLTAVLKVPVLTEPVTSSILFAWAYLESLSDVKRIFDGGKVPLLKTAADWRTGINGIKDFGSEVPGGDGSVSEAGLSYKNYLGIMLYLMDEKTQNMRTMDVMEMDIRLTPGNRYFRMDACFDAYTAEIAVSSGFGYHYDLKKSYGYE